jgi:hypothetical protein
MQRIVSKQKAKNPLLGFVTANGGRYAPRVMQAAGILDHLDASDMKTKPP